MNIQNWTHKIYKTAKDHGWWDKERGFPEIIALCHSELSEAVEQYRLAKPMIWHADNGKPEGVAVELIDCVIRILDAAGHYNIDMDTLITADSNLCGAVKNTDFYEILCRIHEALSKALEDYRSTGKPEASFNGLAESCNWIFAYLNKEDIGIQAILKDKHTYNESRPYRHGNKAA